jgi:solute carrier family 25 S-adenosylmethionine transporter 26
MRGDTAVGGSLWREAAGGFVAGAATDAAFYSIDGYKAQLQSGLGVDYRRMSRGLVSLSLVGNAPSLAFFFASYSALKQSAVGDSAAGVLAASLVCAVPASLISVPGDTLKKRVVLGVDRSPSAALRAVMKSSSAADGGTGVRGLFVGWQANMAKDVPFAAMKMTLYEGLLRLAAYMAPGNRSVDDLREVERAGVGFCSGAVTAVLTNPLDVVNTRMKVGMIPASQGIVAGANAVFRAEGPAALFAGLAPRVLIIGFGSSLFFFLLEHAKTSYDTLFN